MTDAIDIIRSEHINLNKVLDALEDEIARLESAEGSPSLDLLFSILYYIRVFPDRLHHPKEEDYLFPALRRRRPDLAPILDRLERQHVEGARQLADLDRLLKDYDRDRPAGFAALKDAVRRYVDAQRAHIGTEEREVLPLARECLTKTDWGDIGRAFATNADPLFGDNLETGFRSLFERIVR